MSIFDLINTQASEAAAAGAAAGAQVFATPANFDGTRTEPTEGFVLPVAPATKVLYGYQLAAVETILTHRRLLLGLQPGLGKTAIMQAVIAAEAAQGRKSLVIVPPSLRISPWVREFAADYPHLRVALVEGKTAAEFPEADVIIIGHSPVFASRLDDVRAWAPDHVFVDEAHNFKTVGAQCSVALRTLADELPASAMVVLATGTIVANHAHDAYSPLRITGAHNATAVSGGSSWSTFRDSWFETQVISARGRLIKKVVGCSDPEGLRAALVRSCYVSVPRETVLSLPPRTTSVTGLSVNGDGAEYRRMEKAFISWVRENKGDAAAERAAKAEAVTKLMALWEADGKAKVKSSTSYASALVEQGEQVVVFANHRSVVEALYSAFLAEGLRVGTIVGGMSSEAKAAVVDAFQAGDLDIVLGNIQAAGTGLTLTASCHVVFVQLPWAPGTYGQACDRIYRIGQERHVTTHVLNMVEGVSEHLWAVLVEKARVADAINTGTPSTIDEETIISAVLESYGW